MLKNAAWGIALLSLGNCAITSTRPKEEMAMAQAAFIAAKEHKGYKYAPKFFRKAESYYIRAKASYRRKHFAKAKQYALLSKKFSEQSELISIKKKALDIE